MIPTSALPPPPPPSTVSCPSCSCCCSSCCNCCHCCYCRCLLLLLQHYFDDTLTQPHPNSALHGIRSQAGLISDPEAASTQPEYLTTLRWLYVRRYCAGSLLLTAAILNLNMPFVVVVNTASVYIITTSIVIIVHTCVRHVSLRLKPKPETHVP